MEKKIGKIKKVFLIHTERPKLYEKYVKDLDIKTYCPKLANPYSL